MWRLESPQNIGGAKSGDFGQRGYYRIVFFRIVFFAGCLKTLLAFRLLIRHDGGAAFGACIAAVTRGNYIPGFEAIR
jgi:hypothetical protein